MPIDASIPLMVKPFDGLESLGKMYAIQHMQAQAKNADIQAQEGRQRIQLNDQHLQNVTRDAADEAAIREQLKNVDPNDLDSVTTNLMKGGHGTAAMKYQKQLMDHRKASTLAASEHLDMIAKANKQSAALLNAVDAHPEMYPEIRDQMRQKVATLGDPNALALFDKSVPTEYDKGWVQSKRDSLMSFEEQRQASEDSNRAQLRAYDEGTGTPDPKTGVVPIKQATIDHGITSLGHLLAHTDNDQQWKNTIQDWRMHNHSSLANAVVAKFDENWSADAVKRAKALAVTQEQEIANTRSDEQLRISNEHLDVSKGQLDLAKRRQAYLEAHPKAEKDDPKASQHMREYQMAESLARQQNASLAKRAHDYEGDPANAPRDPGEFTFPDYDSWRQHTYGLDSEGNEVEASPPPAAVGQPVGGIQRPATPAKPVTPAAPVAPTKPDLKTSAPPKAQKETPVNPKESDGTGDVFPKIVSIPGRAKPIRFNNKEQLDEFLKLTGGTLSGKE